ncbi:hypothetical protein ACHAXS_007961 [Conticribra weissflogii]
MAQDSANTPTSLLSIKRKQLLSLDTQKKALESEAEAIVSELTALPPGGGQPIGIDTPLVDNEGFPRADIDVYRARSLRKRFHEIQTDHKELSKKIDRGLLEISALTKNEQPSTPRNASTAATICNGDNVIDAAEIQARLAPKPKPKFDAKTGKWVVKNWDGSVSGVENGEMRSFDDLNAPSPAVASAMTLGDSSNQPDDVNDGGGSGNIHGGTQQPLPQLPQPLEEEPTTPFALIDEVSPNSPAHEAGILVGDLLLRFGTITSENHREFRAIAELVPQAAAEKRSIPIAVRRQQNGCETAVVKVLSLRPRAWAGRGLLGCHIKPC